MYKFESAMEKESITLNDLIKLLTEYGEVFKITEISCGGRNVFWEIPSREFTIKIVKPSTLEFRRSELLKKIDFIRNQLKLLNMELELLNDEI